MVAVKVASVPPHLISVRTVESSTLVSTLSWVGAILLSGERALETALAKSWSGYSSFIVASNIFALQLFAYQLVDSLQE